MHLREYCAWFPSFPRSVGLRPDCIPPKRALPIEASADCHSQSRQRWVEIQVGGGREIFAEAVEIDAKMLESRFWPYRRRRILHMLQDAPSCRGCQHSNPRRSWGPEGRRIRVWQRVRGTLWGMRGPGHGSQKGYLYLIIRLMSALKELVRSLILHLCSVQLRRWREADDWTPVEDLSGIDRR